MIKKIFGKLRVFKQCLGSEIVKYNFTAQFHPIVVNQFSIEDLKLRNHNKSQRFDNIL